MFNIIKNKLEYLGKCCSRNHLEDTENKKVMGFVQWAFGFGIASIFLNLIGWTVSLIIRATLLYF